MNNCYQKSTVTAYNTVPQTLAVNGIVALPTGSSTGKSITLANNAININNGGLYKIIVNANGVSGTGAVTLQLRNNNVNITGALGTATLAAADNTALGFSYILNIPNCPCGVTTPTSLTVVNTGVSATVTNITVTVEKIA